MRKDLKPEMNKKYNTVALYTICTALIIVCFIFAVIYNGSIFLFLKKLTAVLSPVLYGFVFAYLLCPVCNFFDGILKKLKGEKKVHKYFLNYVAKHGGLVITYVLFISALVGLFYIVIPQITDSFNSFYENYKIYIARAENFINKLDFGFGIIPDKTLKSIEQSLVSMLERIVESAVGLVTEYSPILIDKVSGFAMGVWNIVLGIIISIYMLAERKNFMREARKIVYSFLPAKRANYFCAGVKKVHEVFGGFINGKILDSIIIGILCFAGTSALRIPYASLISLIVGITNVIPYFGPFMGAIPSVIIVFLNDPVKAVWFGIFVLVLQQLDGNFIGPKILGQTIGVSSFWIITSLLVMGGLYGVLGMVLAVPLFAIVRMLLSKVCNGILMRKGISVTDEGVVMMETSPILCEEEIAEVFDGEYAMQNEPDFDGVDGFGNSIK